MSMLTDNSKRYGLISQVLHWGVAGLTIAAYVTGEALVDATDADKGGVMDWHASLSILVAGLFMLRTGWRSGQTNPEELNQSKVLVVVHKLVVLALYALPVALTVTGVFSVVASGQPVAFFDMAFLAGWTVVDIPLSELTQTTHVYLAHAVIVVFALHTLAALWHQFVKRDGTLARMLPISLSQS